MAKKKIVDKNFSVYDQTKINEWKSSLATIPEKIDRERQAIRQHEAQLKIQQNALQKLQTERLDPVESLIAKLNAQIKFLTLPKEIKSLREQIAPLEIQANKAKKRLAEVQEVIRIHQETIAQLNRRVEIKELEAANKELEKRKLAKEQEIAGLPLALITKTDQVQSLRRTIGDLKDQLAEISKEPINTSLAPSTGYTTSIQTPNGGYTSSISANQPVQSSYTSSNSNQSQQSLSANKFAEISYVNNQLEQLKKEKKEVKRQTATLEIQLNNLQADLSSISNKLRANELTLNDFASHERRLAKAENMSDLKSEVSNQVRQQIPFTQEKSSLDKNISELTLELKTLNSSLSKKESDLKYYSTRRGEQAQNSDLKDLSNQLESQEKIQAPLLKERQQFRGDIKQLNDHISSGKRTISQLETRHQELNSDQFMHKFWTQPEVLINELLNLSNETLDRFEEQHPGNQSDQTRLSLADIRAKLSLIQNLQYQSMYSDFTGNLFSTQSKYFQLCGLLWTELNKLDQQEDFYLAEEIAAILRRNNIQSQLAINEYNKLGLQPMTKSELDENEDRAYQIAVNTMQSMLDPLDENPSKEQQKLYKSGTHLLESIKEKRGSEPPNSGLLKFHTTILQTAAQMTQPHDRKVDEKFHHLIEENKDGKPSLTKKIMGAALAFFSVAGSIVSTFFLPPIGIVASICGGVAGTGAGIGLFASGRSKGTDKDLKDFEKDAKNMKFFPPPRISPTLTIPSAPPNETTSLLQDEQLNQRLYPDFSYK